jgi:hypothetical protein
MDCPPGSVGIEQHPHDETLHVLGMHDLKVSRRTLDHDRSGEPPQYDIVDITAQHGGAPQDDPVIVRIRGCRIVASPNDEHCARRSDDGVPGCPTAVRDTVAFRYHASHRRDVVRIGAHELDRTRPADGPFGRQTDDFMPDADEPRCYPTTHDAVSADNGDPHLAAILVVELEGGQQLL